MLSQVGRALSAIIWCFYVMTLTHQGSSHGSVDVHTSSIDYHNSKQTERQKIDQFHNYGGPHHSESEMNACTHMVNDVIEL